MSKKTNKIQTGFTLIEVVLTIALVVITLGLYQISARLVTLNRWNRYKEIALTIADKEMQTLRSNGYATLPASGSFSDSLMSTLPSGAGSITITTLNAKTKNVVVTVTWANPQHTGNQQLQLQTYITQGGVGQ